MRTGIVVKKIGMTQCYTELGVHVPATVLKLESVQIVAQKTKAKDGYDAVLLGAGAKKAKNVGKAQAGLFNKGNILPKQKLAEFRIAAENMLNIGDEILPDHFQVGQFVDITGVSIGKGFAGSMKRHNFGGLRATHGVSISHRSHGSTGHSQDPGKVFKGKKMAGHMGARRVQMQNLEVLKADNENGLLLVKGGVPGAKNSWLLVRDAVKKSLPEGVKFPGSVRAGASANAAAKVETETPVQATDADTKPETQTDAPNAQADTPIPQEASQNDAPNAQTDAPKNDAVNNDATQTDTDKKE